MDLRPLLRQLRRARGKRRLPKVPLPHSPKGLEREYQRQLRAMLAMLKEATERILLPQLASLARQAATGKPGARADAWDTELGDALDRIRLLFERQHSTEEIRRIARSHGEKVSTFNRTQTLRQTKRVLGVDVFLAEPYLQNQLAGFAFENAGLIRSLEDRYLSSLRSVVVQGFASGQRWEQIAEEIGARFEVTQSQADLIARDQVNKLNGQLTGLRQQELGLAQYEWSTAGDDRVRATHARNDGRIFRWDRPPATGHPGHEINCRCVALPVFEEDLASGE